MDNIIIWFSLGVIGCCVVELFKIQRARASISEERNRQLKRLSDMLKQADIDRRKK